MHAGLLHNFALPRSCTIFHCVSINALVVDIEQHYFSVENIHTVLVFVVFVVVFFCTEMLAKTLIWFTLTSIISTLFVGIFYNKM